jgi:hypothetical protein
MIARNSVNLIVAKRGLSVEQYSLKSYVYGDAES